MSKSFVVTAEMLPGLDNRQGTYYPPVIGSTVHVISKPRRFIRKGGEYVEVTDYTPSQNTLHLIARRNHPDAKKYGWDKGADLTEQWLKEKSCIWQFNRWYLDTSFIPLAHLKQKENETPS